MIDKRTDEIVEAAARDCALIGTRDFNNPDAIDAAIDNAVIPSIEFRNVAESHLYFCCMRSIRKYVTAMTPYLNITRK